MISHEEQKRRGWVLINIILICFMMMILTVLGTMPELGGNAQAFAIVGSLVCAFMIGVIAGREK
jgi:quinol-cytochrome oxidoreductase complex cytochrome b subunit